MIGAQTRRGAAGLLHEPGSSPGGSCVSPGGTPRTSSLFGEETCMPASARRLVAASLALSFVLLVPAAAQAYVGPGPGLELVPYFFSLLAWAGLACGAA